ATTKKPGLRLICRKARRSEDRSSMLDNTRERAKSSWFRCCSRHPKPSSSLSSTCLESYDLFIGHARQYTGRKKSVTPRGIQWQQGKPHARQSRPRRIEQTIFTRRFTR